MGVNFPTEYWPVLIAVISVIVSIIALVVSIQSWYKLRAIYEIAKFKFPKRVGDSKTKDDIEHEKALNDKLKTGKWQILHIYEQPNHLMIVIGKLKK